MALTTIKTGGLADNSVTDAKVANAITVTGAQTGITQVGTLSAGTWQGTPITSAYLNAAQTAVTSVGTLTALTVDNIGVNGNTITANSGALNLTPASGSAIVLDGTINIDAGVVTGATSVTSTAFVGNVTGNVSGTAPAGTLTGNTLKSTVVTSSLTTVGALSSGSIASGFGTISTGNAITTTGVGTFASLDISGAIDVDGVTNLDVVDIDGAVNMAADLTSTANIIVDSDSKGLTLGADQDVTLFSDEVGLFRFARGTDVTQEAGDTEGWTKLRIGNNTDATYLQLVGGEGGDSQLYMYGDNGETNDYNYRMTADNGGLFNIESYSTGSWVKQLVIDGSAGKVGIGCTPAFSLDVQSAGDVIAWRTSAGLLGKLGYNGSDTDNGQIVVNDAGSEKIRLLANGASYINGGSVGIGEASPDGIIHIKTASDHAHMYLEAAAHNKAAVLNLIGSGEAITDGNYPVTISSITSWNATDTFANIDVIATAVNTSDMLFYTQLAGSKAERMRISGAGVCTWKSGSSAMSFEEYQGGAVLWLDGVNGDMAGGDYWGLRAIDGGGSFAIDRAGTPKMTITTAGDTTFVGDVTLAEGKDLLPATNNSGTLGNDGHMWDALWTNEINSSSDGIIYMCNQGGTIQAEGKVTIDLGSQTVSPIKLMSAGKYVEIGALNASHVHFVTNVNSSSDFYFDGGVEINGSLSKLSGSFKIPHPLPQKNETHNLIHSFVESPQADNIYRGQVDLVGGTATVNIDTIAGMTDGTFIVLNREIQCFTSNESGWTSIKGNVSGNILTITAEDNSCTDTIHWLVIGERKDQHMYDRKDTDSDGKIILEPEVSDNDIQMRELENA